MQLMRGTDIGTPIVSDVRGDADSLDVMELQRQCRALQEQNAALQQDIAAMRLTIKELERVAERDTLTPLFNRRHFLATIKKRLLALTPGEQRGAVVFMDVNQLKAINDRYGHAAGDAALVEIAARIDRHIGSDEVAARIGGDEFGLILNSADREAALATVDNIRRALQASKARIEGAEIALSACFGVAMLRGGESGVSILAEADREMYSAKRYNLASHVLPELEAAS